MKKLAILGIVALGGCASFATTVAAADVQIQAAVQTACGFEPTLASLDTLISAAYPTLWTAASSTIINSIANSICKAETAVASKRLAGRATLAIKPVPVTIDGVLIQFVGE